MKREKETGFVSYVCIIVTLSLMTILCAYYEQGQINLKMVQGEANYIRCMYLVDGGIAWLINNSELIRESDLVLEDNKNYVLYISKFEKENINRKAVVGCYYKNLNEEVKKMIKFHLEENQIKIDEIYPY